MSMSSMLTIIPLKLSYSNFRPFAVLFRNQQPQVSEKYSYMFNLRHLQISLPIAKT